MKMIRRILISFITVFFISFSTGIFANEVPKTVNIGIVVPIELPAMKEIVDGFKDQLRAKGSQFKFNFIVKNAQGDANLQRSILQSFANQNLDIIAPIGTNATQMAIAMIRNKPIIGIAADNIKENAKKSNNMNVTGVLDEVDSEKQILFIREALPKIKYITLIHTSDNRIFQQVKHAKAIASKYGITIQDKMINQLSDLYSVSQQINPKSQAIFILKDELIVAGINTLIKQSQAKKIPIIASDDGSVQKGAAFSVGVSERQIGIDSADIVLRVLTGTSADKLPVTVMEEYSVFVNLKETKAQHLDLARIEKAASQFHYPVVIF